MPTIRLADALELSLRDAVVNEEDRGALLRDYWQYHPRFTFLKTLRKGARLLDVGAASGGLANWRTVRFPDRSDIRMYAADLAVGEHFDKYEDYDICDLDSRPLKFPKNFFDGVCASHVYEYLKYPDAFLRQMYDLLAEGGRFYIELPSPHTVALPHSDSIREQGYPVIAASFSEDRAHVATAPVERIAETAWAMGFATAASGVVTADHVADELLAYTRAFDDTEIGLYGFWAKTRWSSYLILEKPDALRRYVDALVPAAPPPPAATPEPAPEPASEPAPGLAERLRPFAGKPLPIYIDASLQPRLTLDSGPTPHRLIVCSFMKSGTYLVAEILKKLGLAFTGLHLMDGLATDYRFVTLDEARNAPEKHSMPLGLASAAALIGPGQFAVGHIGCDERVRGILSGFKVLFLHREMRQTFVSHLRFFSDTARETAGSSRWKHLPDGPDKTLAAMDDFGTWHFDLCADIARWRKQSGVLSLSFETLYGDEGQERRIAAVRALADFLGLPVADVGDAFFDSVHEKPTKTWSGRRTTIDPFWDDRVERRFKELGGPAINRALGYTKGRRK